MKPSELTAEEVRFELESLIEKYPNERGAVIGTRQYEDEEYGSYEEEDLKCAYYADEHGTPIVDHMYNIAESHLVTPVCIIGKWIEEFHPEFKEDEVISRILIHNSTIRAWGDFNDCPFDPEVRTLLANAQDTQDRGDKVWADIDLDVNPNTGLI